MLDRNNDTLTFLIKFATYNFENKEYRKSQSHLTERLDLSAKIRAEGVVLDIWSGEVVAEIQIMTYERISTYVMVMPSSVSWSTTLVRRIVSISLSLSIFPPFWQA